MQENSFIFQLIILSTIVILLLGFAAVMIFQLAIKQKKKFLIEKQEAEMLYLREINQTKIEIKDQTLKHVANELHDNIGQLIALARIQIKTLQKKYADEGQLSDLNQITENALNEIRQLSNSLNDEWINTFGLSEALQKQQYLIERSGKIKFVLTIEGRPLKLKLDHELILFRICQEFVSNTLKYAEATQITVQIKFSEQEMMLTLKDNGKGFDFNNTRQGNGLLNIQTRMKLLQADSEFTSSPDSGTQLSIRYKYKQHEL